jgi:hypothetical protein
MNFLTGWGPTLKSRVVPIVLSWKNRGPKWYLTVLASYLIGCPQSCYCFLISNNVCPAGLV